MSIERFGQNPLDVRGVFPRINFTINREILGGGPSFRTYRGETQEHHHSVERNLTDFDYFIHFPFPETRPIDAIITGRIDHARKAKRNVVVVELGGGVGNLPKQALSEQNVLQRTRKALAGKLVDTEVRFYSLIDSPTALDHMRRLDFPEANLPENDQIRAEMINYSITSSQRLRDLLPRLGENSASLILASSFMTYLQPQVFELVLRDIVECLEPGGQFMAFDYASIAGKFLSIDDGYAEEDHAEVFKDPKVPDDSGISGDYLRAWGRTLLENGDTTDDQITEAIFTLHKIMLSSDMYLQPHWAGFPEQIRQSYKAQLKGGTPPRVLFLELLDEELPAAEYNLRVERTEKEKNDILDRLAEEYADVASIEHKKAYHRDQAIDGIVIKKRLEGKRKAKRDLAHANRAIDASGE